MRVQCCVCKKVKKNGAWREVPKTIGTEPVSHSYCPACLSEAEAAFRAERTNFVLAARHSLRMANT